MTTADEAPLTAHRHRVILELLRERGQVSTTSLAESLGVTHETTRRDLIHLQERGLLRRVHGGAVPVGSLADEVPVGARTAYADEKARIAERALQFVPDLGALLLDSGTTTLMLAESLPRRPGITAITSSLPVALALLPRVGSVTALGGRVRAETQATTSVSGLDAIRADVVFLGANAISLDHGLATPDEAEAVFKGALIRAAQLRVLLADSSKIGRESVFRYATLADVDVLVTDTNLPAAEARRLTEATGVEVILA